MLQALAQCAVRQHRVVAAAGIADAACGRRHQEQDVHPAGSKISASRSRLGRTPSIHIVSALRWKNGSLPSNGSALYHRAAGAKHHIAFVGNDDTGPGTARGVLDDLVGQVMHVDHGLADAGLGELVEYVIEQRLSRHAHQRLRHMVGQRAHAQTETGGKDHGFGGRNGHLWNFSNQISVADHTTTISPEPATSEALVAADDGRTTAVDAAKPQTSASSTPRLAAFFFLSPCFQEVDADLIAIDQASSQRR